MRYHVVFCVLVACEPAQAPRPAVPIAPAAAEPVAAEPEPAPQRMARAEIVKEIGMMFWGDRLLVESARDDPNRCAKFMAEAAAKIRGLRESAPTNDKALMTAIARIERCLECIDASWDACWDVPTSLREIGAPTTPPLSRDDRPKVTGPARTKERAAILRGVESHLKKVIKTCKDTPDRPRAVADSTYELELRARALDPPDDNVVFAASLLADAAECDPNTENYVRVVRDIALPRSRSEPDGRVIRSD